MVKAYYKDYYEEHSEVVKSRSKQYHQEHKEKKLAYAKNYRLNNPDYAKNYREKNKEARKAYVSKQWTCEWCDKTMRYHSQYYHKKKACKSKPTQ